MNAYYETKMMIQSAITVEYLERLGAEVDRMADSLELSPRQVESLDKLLVDQYDRLTANQ